MAKYDQGGGCACGLERWCSCSSHSQANGLTVEADRKAHGYFKTSDGGWRKDRSDPEGGIPGRAPSVMRADPRSRGRAARRKHESERSKRRLAELDEQARIVRAVEGLSLRATKVWKRLKQGQWYTDPTPAILELQAAGLLVYGGRIAVIRAAYLPIGSTPYVVERIPENLP